MSKPHLITAFILAALSSAFMSTGMIVNSLLEGQGMSWTWTASLRFLLLLPMLVGVVASRKRLLPLLAALRSLPLAFLLWGNLGFGGFYTLLVCATHFLPAWLVTAAFMTTILTGLLLAPLIYRDHRAVVPRRALALALGLLACLALMEFDQLQHMHYSWWAVIGLLLAFLAAVLWPLCNRMLLLRLEARRLKLDPLQRSLGMTLGSLPVLITLAVYAYVQSGLPGKVQLAGSLSAAFFAGLIGCVLFFKALNLTQRQPMAMAAVEAMQVLVIFFTLLGESLVRQLRPPGPWALAGMTGVLLTLATYIQQTFKTTPELS
ncbi:multidrug resistance efflux transporter family protein [Mucilaginibacter litoreus]|uniref:Multidrug resistance efflux transporter family protein n=1 Tax=Mucilaginibacter litoreus TaxID=1048221 RepID=A0ABW3AMZ5_9SPHI